MRIALAVVVATLLSPACKKKGGDGLPPADNWGETGQAQAQPQPQPNKMNPHAQGGSMANPHGDDTGLPPGHPPTDPDLPPGHPPMQGEPSGPDVTKMGLQPPDPQRAVDPKNKISGTIKVDAKAKDNVKAGGAVFLIVKKADANGAPSGPPLAVDKVMFSDGLKFELTEAQAMVAGTKLEGDVVVSARYDQDSDAISKQPGDVTGMVRVKVPAAGVVLKLDTVLQ